MHTTFNGGEPDSAAGYTTFLSPGSEMRGGGFLFLCLVITGVSRMFTLHDINF